jgi:hypothetical protein
MACVLADAKLGEDDGGYRSLDIVQLALVEMADWKNVANTPEIDAKIVDLWVAVFAYTGS